VQCLVADGLTMIVRKITKTPAIRAPMVTTMVAVTLALTLVAYLAWFQDYFAFVLYLDLLYVLILQL
jgi:hypothetical protein